MAETDLSVRPVIQPVMGECREACADGIEETVFGRESRLRNRLQLEEMKREGVKAAGRRCVLVVLRTPPDGKRRAAFLISRRYSLLAVERNRARRLFREVYRRLWPQLPPVWLVFIPRHGMKGATMGEVYRDICAQAARAGLSVQETP